MQNTILTNYYIHINNNTNHATHKLIALHFTNANFAKNYDFLIASYTSDNKTFTHELFLINNNCDSYDLATYLLAPFATHFASNDILYNAVCEKISSYSDSDFHELFINSGLLACKNLTYQPNQLYIAAMPIADGLTTELRLTNDTHSLLLPSIISFIRNNNLIPYLQ